MARMTPPAFEADPRTSVFGVTVATKADRSLTAAERLLKCAVELFSERGFHGTTTRDISRRAGSGESAIYDHYQSKEEMLYLVTRLAHEEAGRRLHLADAAAGRDPMERLTAVTHAFSSFHAEWRTAARVANHELDGLSPKHLADIIALREKVEAKFVEILTAGEQAGRFALPGVRATAFAIISMCIGISRWYRESGSLNQTQIGNLYARLVAQMVSPGEPSPDSDTE